MEDIDVNTNILRTIQSIDGVDLHSIIQYGTLNGPVPGVILWEAPLDDAGRRKVSHIPGVS